MSVAEIAVIVGGIGAIAFVAWFFFGPKQARTAQVKGNVQEIEITVKGGVLTRRHSGQARYPSSLDIRPQRGW